MNRRRSTFNSGIEVTEDINEHILKIAGGISLSDELKPSERGNITYGEFDIYSVEKRDNQDGTFNLIYKAKFVSDIKIDQQGRPIRGIDKTKKSRKLRGAIWWLSEEEKVADREEFYETVMDKIIANLSEVWEFVKHK